jgi:hypothetical protein
MSFTTVGELNPDSPSVRYMGGHVFTYKLRRTMGALRADKYNPL